MSITTSLADLQVVLVEPSPTQANLVTRMLKNLGVVSVRACGTAVEALQTLSSLERGSNGVVVSSLYLPDMSGVDLVQGMRGDSNLEIQPFILISSETRPQVLDPVRQSGACSILTKPFTEQQLSRALYAAADYLNPPEDFDASEVAHLRVLLVDDSATTRRHLRRLLGQLGIERIYEANNGREAVAFLQDSTVDLVITDYNMPEMDGFQLTEYIRTQSWQNSVPILMVTSEYNQDRLAAVQRAGVSAICDKPFEGTSLRQLICQAVSD